ncbi:MAG: hypothetical protein ACKVOX_11025 [Rhizobacter sp.]
MTSIEEFSFIAAQLEWLEQRLRVQPLDSDPSRMEGALNALACARAVIVQLSNIGSALEKPPVATPVR